MRMMDEPVNDRYGHVVIDKEFVSVGKFLISRQDDGTIFVQRIDQLKQVVHAVFIHGKITQLINDQDIELDQLIDFLFLIHP